MAKQKPNLTLASSSEPSAEGSAAPPPEMRMRAFTDRVAERAGLRPADARAAATATLQVLGEALRDGREMRLAGLGKVKILNSKAGEKRRVVTVRVVMDAAKDPLADPGEDG